MGIRVRFDVKNTTPFAFLPTRGKGLKMFDNENCRYIERRRKSRQKG